ncbi:DUF2848 family protein [Salisediminibacterium halotolerans]|uniref:DUF2848 domain-containing protein n=1 Tax=Salisediminibacterium halotolerans TaxID=517425 RepID=A0A1H9UBV5_9BACI|nr:DUF2848 family protein [Salisediminibacterium haloalkalitolerans]SES06644.1 Protein of unknown function [Salisediminibacterium haloalkalitolerans]
MRHLANPPTSYITFSEEGTERTFSISAVTCIGYSGRNQDKVQEHIDELAEIGVPRPMIVPTLFPQRLSTVNTRGDIEVLGTQTSGEIEPVLIFGESEDDLFISVGSDHTDRDLETVDIAKSKQVCDKPLSKNIWPVKDIADHWDQIELKTELLINGEWKTYQNHDLSAILPVEEIISHLKKHDMPTHNAVYYIGTVPLLLDFTFAERYVMTLHDPVLSRSLMLTYNVRQIDL